MLDSFLIPPRNIGDGSTRREPSLAQELQDEATLVWQSALKDVVTYSVDNALNGADHDIRRAINIRHNMKWVDCDSVIAEAQQLVGPAIEKVIAERDAVEAQRITFNALVALFYDIRLQKNCDDPNKYDLIGVSEHQVRKCAAALAQGTDE